MAATAAAATAGATSRTQEANENFNFKACLNDLTKIPQKEFEAQFRNWMEKDGVARAMQAKLRADLVANFNKTNLGKHIIGQTPTTRLTLTPIEMALNTLVAEFLFAQNCHFTLSVYSTEAPFRNTLPDFDSSNYFRFKENEVTEIVKAICGPLNYDWNIKNRVFKNYTCNKTTALLYFILKALLESNAETAQQKVTVGTNTRPLKMPTFGNQPPPPPPPLSSDNFSTEQTRRDSKADFYNTNFRYLNRYLIILSRKVKDMSEQFEKLQYNKGVGGGGGQPRVRNFKSMGRRKYDDLNRSLERVTENLKQMANAKRKSRRVGTIVKAIEALAAQFQKCAKNFEHVSKNLKSSAHFKTNPSTTSSELINPNAVPNPSVTTTNAAASQTDMFAEKSFVDWLHEMRYTRNGQKFLDRIERSFLKALEKQKRELLTENEVKLRHQKELLRIRYKQKVLQEICSHGSLSARRNEMPASNVQSNETISEQFRQFELKHFDLLSKIYESETEHRASDSRNPKEIPTGDKAVHFNVKENKPLAKSSSEFETDDVKITSSSDNIEQPQQSRQVLKEKNVKDLRQQVKEAIGEIVSEERNADQIVMDAKQRIRELEQESNQLAENFLGYLDRQREQKLAAREAAQSLWHDYVQEREKMQQHYIAEGSQESKFKEAFEANEAKYFADLQNQQKADLRQKLDIFLRDQEKAKIDATKQHEPPEAVGKHNSVECSSSSSSYMELKNPIIQAKENFFERERQFKAATTKRLLEHAGDGVGEIEFDDFLRINATKNGNKIRAMTSGPCLDVIYQPPNSWMATNAAEAANTQIVKTAVASTLNAQLAANWQGSLERPQNGSVNKSQRREIIATAKEAVRYQRTTQNTTELTTNAILAAAAVVATASAATTTTTTHTTIPRVLNKNNAAGASVAEAQQEHSNNHKIKNDVVGYGQEHTPPPTVMEQQQNEMRNTNNNYNYNSKCNNNKTGNFKSNGSTAFETIATETSTAAAVPISTVQTSKPSIAKPKVSGSSASSEFSRKTVLKQSMARMQQLFSPHQHQQQQQQQHRQQQIMLADVSEEEENDNCDAESSLEKMEKSWLKEKRMLQSINNNNNNNNTNDNNNDNNNRKHNKDTTNTQSPHVVFDADSENVVGHYKNNLLSKQKIIKGKAKDQHQQQQIPTTSLRNNHEHKRTVTATNNSITSTTLHSIDEGNKTVEALVDWQQIACGPSGRQNEAAVVNVDKVKVTNATAVSAVMRGYDYNDYNDNNKEQPLEKYDDDDDDDDDDFERHIENELALHLPLEPGEIFESNQTPPEMVSNHAEMGELLDQLSNFGDDDVVPLRSTSPTTSDVSSIDLRMSFGGGGSGNGMREGINAGSSLNVATAGAFFKTGNASDSGSDFWA